MKSRMPECSIRLIPLASQALHLFTGPAEFEPGALLPGGRGPEKAEALQPGRGVLGARRAGVPAAWTAGISAGAGGGTPGEGLGRHAGFPEQAAAELFQAVAGAFGASFEEDEIADALVLGGPGFQLFLLVSPTPR